jgi:hypothetical protein
LPFYSFCWKIEVDRHWRSWIINFGVWSLNILVDTTTTPNSIGKHDG